MKAIELTRGLVTLIDDEDFEDISEFTWKIDGAGYVCRQWICELKIHTELLHRRLKGLSYGDGKVVDHINRDPLDNRRSNLRICDRSQNQCNVGILSSNTSGFKGVSKSNRKGKKWRADIQVRGRRVALGCFFTIEEARIAYQSAADELHGEFANYGGLRDGLR